jgi:hypothetical protein
MPARRISAARTARTCPNEFAHDGRIHPGQRTLVTTYFPSDEHVRDFGVAPFTRVRVCLHCTSSKLRETERTGTTRFIHGVLDADLDAAGLTPARADTAHVKVEQRASA